MKKAILYFLGVIILLFVGTVSYFFFAGEIKNTLQFDDSRFVSIQKFIKQGKVESLSQAKLQLSLIANDYKPDSVLLLKEELNEVALANAKVCLQKKWLGSCQKYIDLIDKDYKADQVEVIKEKLFVVVNEENISKTKNYLKERNISKTKVYFAKIDTTYNRKKVDALEKKVIQLDNELKVEKVIELMNDKKFDDAKDVLSKVDEDYDIKTTESLAEEIKLKEELEDLLDDEGAVGVFVEYVKKDMNDPESFEHVRTLITEKGKYLNVMMKYREVNSYGAKVLTTVEAKLNRDGSVKKIINRKS
ncbi:hypothetical protein [Flammeovirga sp. SJP92]|uniref:hypothetical protein n=1 Tax=Flammeovirga sp. SJP92 TaxID=1775430 RepID=UPI000786FCF4|nr:hypothetical protein [Flammeovirga sp. SJP92]KXX72266.1 hypothetical protein AVL50_01300 [Flammeovirga sp. SJP92]